MSKRYLGGVITANSVTPTGSFQDSAAPGMWTSAQQMQLKAAGLWPLFGNISPDAFIENLFSTYVYASTSGTDNPVVNGINLTGQSGLVWIKSRTRAANHYLVDTIRGSSLNASNTLSSNATAVQTSGPYLDWVQFNNNGFTAKAVVGGGALGTNTYFGNMVGWTFREQPKFFDIQVISHTTGTNTSINLSSLGVVGSVIVKGATVDDDWYVWHRSLNSGNNIKLNTSAAQNSSYAWLSVSGTTLTLNSGAATGTYVVYGYAHNAGGFGLSGTENVISCGSYTGNGTQDGSNFINLGFEPQWVLLKNANAASTPWLIADIIRGTTEVSSGLLQPNETGIEFNATPGAVAPRATGFTVQNDSSWINGNGANYIYIAIRRGPMAVPTLGTSVYSAEMRSGNDTQTDVTNVGFSPDLWMVKSRNVAADFAWFDRLRGVTKWLATNQANRQETFSGSNGLVSINMNGITIGSGALDGGICNDTGVNYANYFFRRAPSFFDEVCYAGTGSTATTLISHNLGTRPELVIVRRNNDSTGANWLVANDPGGLGILNSTNSYFVTANNFNGEVVTTPSYANATTFSITGLYSNNVSATNAAGGNYVAYLFATCPGVSKVGIYNGTGSTQTINCGFTTGARFIMIKRTSDSGAWYVWDTARGISVGNDPYLRLNTNAAEVADDNSIGVNTVGFQLSQNATADVNAIGSSYIFLAIS